MPEPEPTRLRQIALITPDLERARFLMTEVLGAEVIYTDPTVAQWNLENILLAIGPSVLEILAPLDPSTPSSAARLLSKRPHSGSYMLIMQTRAAASRRAHIEAHSLTPVIFTHASASAHMVQYHPRNVPGGVMPELDTQLATPRCADPFAEEYGAWHACGDDVEGYVQAMKRSALRYLRVDVRLKVGDADVCAAARWWEDAFGVRSEGAECVFEDMRLRFLPGERGRAEGIESLTVEVRGKERFERILAGGTKYGLCGDGWMDMIGVRWYFVLKEEDERSRL